MKLSELVAQHKLGEIIKQRRKELNMTQEQLANLSGIKRQHITRLENGTTKNPSLDTLSKLSVSLNYNLFNCLEYEVKKAQKETINITNVSSESVITLNKDSTETQLLSHFDKLNNSGKKEAVKRVEELTELPKYTEKE